MGLELAVDDLYSISELDDAGYEPLRFINDKAIFTASESDNGYVFSVFPLKQLKIRFKYEKAIRLPETPEYTDFEREQYEEDLRNYCGPLRLGIDYTPSNERNR